MQWLREYWSEKGRKLVVLDPFIESYSMIVTAYVSFVR